jgi:hypothetical protein
MTEPRSLSSCERLESAENLAFQERSWHWESVGRWAVALLVFGAVVGLFGGGPLSRTEVATADGNLRVEYPRIARNGATYRMIAYIGPGAIENGQAEIWLDAALMEVLRVEAVAPEPDAVELDRGHLVYKFGVARADGLARIVWHVKTDGVARHEGRIGLRDGASARLTLWLHP